MRRADLPLERALRRLLQSGDALQVLDIEPALQFGDAQDALIEQLLADAPLQREHALHEPAVQCDLLRGDRERDRGEARALARNRKTCRGLRQFAEPASCVSSA